MNRFEGFQPDADVDQRLSALFAEYHAATAGYDVSPQFMPHLWEKIESRRVSRAWRLLTLGFVTTSACLCIGFQALLWSPDTQSNQKAAYSAPYVEVLAEHAEATADLPDRTADDSDR